MQANAMPSLGLGSHLLPHQAALHSAAAASLMNTHHPLHSPHLYPALLLLKPRWASWYPPPSATFRPLSSTNSPSAIAFGGSSSLLA
jgi:hypothetical protein